MSYVSCENHERSSTALYYDDLREVYTIPSPEELADNNAIKTNESTLDLMIKPDDKPVTRTTTTTSSTTITPDTDTDTNTEEASTDTVTGFNDTRPLKRVFLSNRSIVCNDGSQAGWVTLSLSLVHYYSGFKPS